MRKTTIFRATSCSFGRAAILASGLGLLSCGKRGDPLPPLRPVPEAARELVVRQVGDRIRLEWRAPSRNQDGTTEKLELREARVLRRVVDVDALVREQTRPPEPVAPTEAEPEESAPSAPTPVEPGASSAPRPAAPAPRPSLVIPPFAGAVEVIATLESLEPGAAMRYEESIDPTWTGKRVEYAVVHVNRKKRASPLSTILQVEPVPAPEPPTGLAAAAKDGFVSLEWSPPEQGERKDVAVGFAVFRRLEADASYPDSPLSAETLREPFFEDRTAVFGTAACYVVTTVLEPARPEPLEAPLEPGGPPSEESEARSVSEEPASEPREAPPEEETETSPRESTTPVDEAQPPPGVPVVPPITNPVRVESRASEEVCLTPEDVFAPAAPTGLVGVDVGEGILLTWRVVEAPDLRGYRVYRRAESSADFELLVEVETASFTDSAAAPGERYLYAVTAIDGSPAVNESPKSEAVLATRRE